MNNWRSAFPIVGALSFLVVPSAWAQAGTTEPTDAAAAPEAPPMAAPAEVTAPAQTVAPEQVAIAATETGAPTPQPLSQDELLALGVDSFAPAVDLGLKLSGFADVGFGAALIPTHSLYHALNTSPAHSTFYVGNLNVYIQQNLTETLHTMAEVRFSFLPNGSTGYGLEQRVSTAASDYSNYGRVTNWGSIIIQRVYIEWMPHPLFAVRAGEFLTPFGVWNVDHGSPVIIPIHKPWTLGAGWFPEKQTGLEFLGSSRVSADNLIGYHLTVSNGGGPLAEFADLDEHKAFGARLYWENQALGRLRVGFSAYYGRYTDSTYHIAFGAMQGKSEETIATQYDSLGVAGDLTWDVGDFHIQAEFITNQLAYTERGRVLANAFSRTFLPSDSFSWGSYGLVGYRLPWFGIMPFVLLERANGTLSSSRVNATVYHLGLNIRPVDQLVLKAVYEHQQQDSDYLGNLDIIALQVAWAF